MTTLIEIHSPKPRKDQKAHVFQALNVSGTTRCFLIYLEILMKRTSPAIGPGTYTAKRIEDR